MTSSRWVREASKGVSGSTPITHGTGTPHYHSGMHQTICRSQLKHGHDTTTFAESHRWSDVTMVHHKTDHIK